MTPAELAAYRALVPFGIKAAERAEIAALTVAALADVPAEYLHLGADDKHATWGVSSDLARELPWSVPTARRWQVAGAAVMAAVKVMLDEGSTT